MSELPLRELSALTGLPLAVYRPEHVLRQAERARERERASSWDELVARLRRDDEACLRLRRAVAVSVTGRFRDPEQFDLIERELLPELARRFDRLRIWSAGCSDGSELHTLAVVLERLHLLERSFLVGSDVLPENIAAARRTLAEGPALRARLEARDLLDGGPPPGRFALVVCRNLAIYLRPDAKARLHRLLADALSPGGILVVGRSERLSNVEELGLERRGPHTYRAGVARS